MILLRQKPIRAAWVVGHRGTMEYAPENTLAAFNCGLKLGADWLECDVHLSRDRKCVVMHDESVERTTNGHGLIRDLPAAKITRLDAGSWFDKKFKKEKVPLLKDLLLWLKPKRSRQSNPVGLVIEIKNEPVRYFQIEQAVIKEVIKTNMQERVILISFDHGMVKRAKKYSPNILTGILYNRPLKNPFARAKAARADAIFPRRNFITRALVQKARKQNLLLGTWTVNEPKEMKKILRAGVKIITSNVPDILTKILEKK